MDKSAHKIRTLIIDDEPLARQTLRLLLSKDPDIEIIGECANGYETIQSINEQAPDLAFFDIQMPGINGFEILEAINVDRMPVIVFVTAFDQYAVSAFEAEALDYLLKPFTDKRFAKALARAKSQVKQREVNDLSQKLVALLGETSSTNTPPAGTRREGEYLTRLLIKSAGRVFFLKVDEIDWIKADNYYVQLHVGRKAHLLRETMNDLEQRLDPDKFLRIHRSTIVNLDRIQEMQPHHNGDYLVILDNGTQLKLSRSRREYIEERLKLSRT